MVEPCLPKRDPQTVPATSQHQAVKQSVAPMWTLNNIDTVPVTPVTWWKPTSNEKTKIATPFPWDKKELTFESDTIVGEISEEIDFEAT